MLFANLTRKNFINTKNRFNLQELVQVHHIIPLEWKNHKKLSNFNINSGYNLIFLPTKLGKSKINTDRRVHDGGHRDYNRYVLIKLNEADDPFKLVNELRSDILNNNEIPW